MTNQLTLIPYIGPKISKLLNNININSIEDLKNKDPTKLYTKICKQQNKHVDRCVLYVCRSAVYYANNKTHKQEKLKWWNWKDKKLTR